MRVAFVRVSANRKTGPIPVSMSPRRTCPTSCPLRQNGCYAEHGPLSWHWNRLSDGRTGITWHAFLEAIRRLPKGTLWRHNVAGDLPGRGDKVDAEMLADLVEANSGRRGFTYTHKPPMRANLSAIRAANRAGFTINLSADDLVEADELVEKKAGPVVVILPAGAAHNHVQYSPERRRVIICPESYRDDVTCSSCQLCADPGREAIIGFPAHGPALRKAECVGLERKGGEDHAERALLPGVDDRAAGRNATRGVTRVYRAPRLARGR